MTIEALITLAILATMIFCLVAEIGRTPTVLFFALAGLLLTGVISPQQALSGFSNEGTIAIALLFVVAAGIQNTGALDALVRFFLTKKEKSPRSTLMLRMAIPASIFSAFLNNTAIVAVFTPIVKKWSEWVGESASKFLIPLSYATLIGGMCTLIGTSTNLVVNGLMKEAGMEGLSMFELAKIGIPFMIVGWAYLALFAHRVLPDTRDSISGLKGEAKEYVIEMKISKGCEFISKSIKDAGLRNLQNLFLLSIEREGKSLGVASPDGVMREGDALMFVGRTTAILELQDVRGLTPAAHEMFERDFQHMSADFVEAVVSHSSPLVDKTVKEANFRTRYGAGVIAVHRNGERVEGKIGSIKLRAGDTLFLFADPSFVTKWGDSSDFYLISKLGTQEPKQHKKAVVAVAILSAMVLAVTFRNYLPLIGGQKISMIYAAFAAAGLMRLTGCMHTGQAKRALDFNVLATVACAIGISHSLASSGISALIADGIISVTQTVGPVGTLTVIYIATAVLASLITNVAAASLEKKETRYSGMTG